MIEQTASVPCQICASKHASPNVRSLAVMNVNSSSIARGMTYPSPPFSPKCTSKNSRRDAPPPSELEGCVWPAVFEYERVKFFLRASIDTLEDRGIFILANGCSDDTFDTCGAVANCKPLAHGGHEKKGSNNTSAGHIEIQECYIYPRCSIRSP